MEDWLKEQGTFPGLYRGLVAPFVIREACGYAGVVAVVWKQDLYIYIYLGWESDRTGR